MDAEIDRVAGDAGSATGAVVESVSRRVMVIWCPDWPVVSATTEHLLPPAAPVAVVHAGQVVACSETARVEGVRRGMRRRDAAATCPELVVVDQHLEQEVRSFESVLAAIEEVTPTVAPIRPGLCAVGVPARYYGGEAAAAAVMAERLVAAGVWDSRIGVADSMFAAEHAARRADRQDCVLIESGCSPQFLAALPIGGLDDADLVSLLRRLGIRTVGDFAALSARDVLTRFGQQGAWIHRLARGLDTRPAAPRRPPPDLEQQVHFDTAIETIEPIVFSSRQTAERLVAELSRHGLVCSELQIVVAGESGWQGSRNWSHPRWFAASDMIDRLYWQLQAAPMPEPVTGVRLVPAAVESLADHGEGLWGNATNERVERGVARLQGMLGPEAVQAPAVQGGRGARERQAATPWGDRVTARRATGLPWPGRIPPPAPAQVFSTPKTALVLGAEGQPIGVTARGMVTAELTHFRPDVSTGVMGIQAWAGPWPIDELWWDLTAARRVARFQIVGVDGSAWLLAVENGQWWTEARYD